MRSTIKYYKGDASIRVFDKARNVISENEIQKGAIISCTFLLDQIWMTDKKYGINWVVEQAVVYDENQTSLFREEE